MKNKDLKLSIIFTLIGLVAGALMGWYQILNFDEAMKETIISQVGSINIMILISAAQTGLFAFISTFIGLKLARKTNLFLNFKFDKDSFIMATIIGFVVALIIVVSEKFIFAKFLPENLLSFDFSIHYFISSILYGGIVEELMLRLFFMSLIVFILKKMFIKTSEIEKNEKIPTWMYIKAIAVSAIVFAAGHLPAVSQTFGLSVPMVVRVMVLNSIGGIGFGYLYWKKGLSYSILAHMLTHIFNQLILLPLFF